MSLFLKGTRQALSTEHTHQVVYFFCVHYWLSDQGIALAGQVLYRMGHAPSSIAFSLFFT
jgi:hypothetical protein